MKTKLVEVFFSKINQKVLFPRSLFENECERYEKKMSSKKKASPLILFNFFNLESFVKPTDTPLCCVRTEKNDSFWNENRFQLQKKSKISRANYPDYFFFCTTISFIFTSSFLLFVFQFPLLQIRSCLFVASDIFLLQSSMSPWLIWCIPLTHDKVSM